MCLSYHSSEEPYYWVPELISVWERLTQSNPEFFVCVSAFF